MIEKEINSSDKLIKELLSFGDEWVFRGQSNSEWTLKSAVEREIEKMGFGKKFRGLNIKQFEEISSNEFESKYKNYIDESKPESKLGLLAIMQHFGLPTRLLDFTLSPFIALFFAIHNYTFNDDGKFAIWCCNYIKINEKTMDRINQKEKFDSKNLIFDQDAFFNQVNGKYDLIYFMEPNIKNIRLDRQDGTFMISLNPKKEIEDVINIYDDYITKIIVPKGLVNELSTILDKMNIKYTTLFSGLESLANHTKSFTRRVIFESVKSFTPKV